MLYDLYKEEEVLNYLINVADMADRLLAVQQLKSVYFSHEEMAVIYRLFTVFIISNRPVSRQTLEDEIALRHHKADREMVLATIEGMSKRPRVYLTEAIPYLRTLYQRRTIYNRLATEVPALIESGETIENVKVVIFQTMLEVEADQEPFDNAKAARAVMEEIQKDQEDHGSDFLLTGLSEFDRKIQVTKGRYYSVGALPKTGKTTLVTVFINGLCRLNLGRVAVLFFSFEMKHKRIYRKLYSELISVSVRRLKGKGAPLTDEENRLLVDATNLVAAYDLEIIDRPLTPEEGYVAAQRFVLSHPGKHIVIFSDHNKRWKRVQKNMVDQVNDVSAMHYRMANDFDASVFALSQLNTKELMGKEHEQTLRRPNSGMLANSSNIEEDSDTVLLLWRPGLYTGEKVSKRDRMVMIVEKDRDNQAPYDVYFDTVMGYNQIIDADPAFNISGLVPIIYENDEETENDN